MCSSTIKSSNHLHQPTTIHEFHLDVYHEISISQFVRGDVVLQAKCCGWLHECAVCVGVGAVPCVLGLACVQAQNLIFKKC